jgi:hypothetical protein
LDAVPWTHGPTKRFPPVAKIPDSRANAFAVSRSSIKPWVRELERYSQVSMQPILPSIGLLAFFLKSGYISAILGPLTRTRAI